MLDLGSISSQQLPRGIERSGVGAGEPRRQSHGCRAYHSRVDSGLHPGDTPGMGKFLTAAGAACVWLVACSGDGGAGGSGAGGSANGGSANGGSTSGGSTSG